MLQLQGYGIYRPAIQFTGWFEKKLKQKMLHEAGCVCAACGGAFQNPWEAQFHHRNPETKGFHLSHRDMEGRTLEEIEAEHKKGEWLHPDCHKHAHQTNDPNRFDSEYLQNKEDSHSAESKRLGRLRGKIKFSALA